jgi:phosphomethylpyrimidine synthase
MKISHDIRNEAQKEGLTKMAEKFKKKKEIYIPTNSG